MKWREHNALCHRISACDSAVMTGIDQPPRRLSVLFYTRNQIRAAHASDSEQCPSDELGTLEVAMPRYFFDVKDGHRLFDSAGFVCDNDTDAVIRATVLAIGVSLDKPEDDPERRISVIDDAGQEVGTVPVYSKPSYENPAQ